MASWILSATQTPRLFVLAPASPTARKTVLAEYLSPKTMSPRSILSILGWLTPGWRRTGPRSPMTYRPLETAASGSWHVLSRLRNDMLQCWKRMEKKHRWVLTRMLTRLGRSRLPLLGGAVITAVCGNMLSMWVYPATWARQCWRDFAERRRGVVHGWYLLQA